jgi:antitoxin ParD1/3/4
MSSRNVSLTPELERVIDERVKSGMYENASEVVRAGLRALVEAERERKLRLRALRKALEAGDASGLSDDYSVETILQKAGVKRAR